MVLPVANSEAALSKKIIGIQISTTCLKSANCLDNDDIIKYDNSNPRISGEFVKSGDDIKRKCAGIKPNNYYTVMRPQNLTILVDPCYGEANFIPLITIQPSLEAYTLPSQLRVKEIGNSTEFKPIQWNRTISHTRWVDEKCDQAVITAKDWKKVLVDTVRFMTHDCDPKYTKISTISSENKTITKHDIATSSKWKLDQWQKMIKEECIKKRNACTNISNPAVTTNGDNK